MQRYHGRWFQWQVLRIGLPVAVLIILSAAFIITHLATSSLDRIEERGSITVLTRNAQHTYYTYRGEPAGFEYELAAEFAEFLDVELRIETRPWSELIPALRDGEGDFIAAAMTDTEDRRRRVAFSDPYLIVRQQLLVHASRRDVTSMADANGMSVHVRSGTSYEERLKELIGGGLQAEISVHADRPTQDLIRAVAEREVEATVADTHIARLNRRYHPDVRIALALSGPQPTAWAVRPKDDELRREMNRFFASIKDDGTFDRIYDRYYGNTEVFDYVDVKVFHRRLKTRLPQYEEMFRREAERHGFDWRIIAAMAYQESHYHPLATSYTGVRGLMQITLATAQQLGVENRLDPEQSIRGGVAYLDWLYERFEDIERHRDRLLFAMAAYNVGYGHVRDAQQLARDRGLDPSSWRSLEQMLPLLSHPEYYRNLPHGYARGREPVRYIHRILQYYDILRRLEPEE
ncbi:MAG: membrane-bound lytic murein transglycosylase MltF [Spirochaetota bacterium]